MAKAATSDEAPRKRGRPRKDANGHPPPTKAAKAKKAKKETTGTDRFGFRLGSKKSQAAAMYASKTGATLGEVKHALKSTQFNLLNELEEMTGVKISKVKEAGPGARKVTRYQVTGEPR